jgi:hypothetical protein
MNASDYGLEEVFSVGHQYHGRIVYDRVEGSYYDKACDLYLSLAEVKAFGLPV